MTPRYFLAALFCIWQLRLVLLLKRRICLLGPLRLHQVEEGIRWRVL
jgi:hypothetical protein